MGGSPGNTVFPGRLHQHIDLHLARKRWLREIVGNNSGNMS